MKKQTQLFTISMLFFVLFGPLNIDSYESIAWSKNSLRAVAQGPSQTIDKETRVEDVGLDQDQLGDVAEKILSIYKASAQKYTVSDGLCLTMYIIRSMAEIGDYELARKDLLALAQSFEELTGSKLKQETKDVLGQIKKVKFSRKRGRFYAQFFAQNPESGITISINKKKKEGYVKEITKAIIEDKAQIYFDDIDTIGEKNKVRALVKDSVENLGIFKSFSSALNRVSSSLVEHIDDYLERDDLIAPALLAEMKGVFVIVKTKTSFEEVRFEFNQALSLPGIEGQRSSVPSFLLNGQSDFLKLKVSIDQ